MNCNVNIGFGCVFKVQKINADGDVVYEGPEFHNTMLSSGLFKLYTISLINMSAYINIGSGTSAPSSGQTGLENRLFSTSSLYNGIYYWSGADAIDERMYTAYTRVFQFNVGTCTGTFSEVGLSRLNNSEYLNRQLLRNEYGVPTTITVAANEGMRITAEVRCYLNNAIMPYSEVYCMKSYLCDAYGKTITLTNGTSTATFSLNLQISEFIREVNNNLIKKGVNSLYCYYPAGYPNDENGVFYFYGHPLNTEALNISMVSNTITDLGGGDPFEFTCIKPFMGKQSIINNVEYYDDVTGVTQSVEFELFQIKNTSRYCNPAADLLTGYGSSSVSNSYSIDGAKWILSTFVDSPLSYWQMKVANPDDATAPLEVSSSTLLSEPTEQNLSYKIKSYYSPGAIGSGTKRVKGFFIARASDSVYNKVYQYIAKINNFEFTVTDIEEFWTEMTFSWGAV